MVPKQSFRDGYIRSIEIENLFCFQFIIDHSLNPCGPHASVCHCTTKPYEKYSSKNCIAFVDYTIDLLRSCCRKSLSKLNQSQIIILIKEVMKISSQWYSKGDE